MRSSSAVRASAVAALLASAWTSSAGAQQTAQGFDLERLYTSAPGAGWLVMDALDMHGGLGGAVSVVTSYARNPLRVTDGTQHLAVVSDEAFVQLGLAATYERYRLYFTFDSPLTLRGSGGTVGGYAFTAPSVDFGSSPDAISHGRVGFDVRILGAPSAPLRLGLGGQVYFPGGAPGSQRSNYLSDGPPGSSFGAYIGQLRVLFAGDAGALTYAGHVGVNLRALDDGSTPGSPRGSEVLFGAAAGVRLPVCGACGEVLIVGPEVYGATALRSFLDGEATALESLFTARLEGSADDRPQLRVKLGAGPGLDQRFGAPQWRLVVGVELFQRSSPRPER